MIKANELRIGNLVMDKISGEWMVVDEIGKNVGATIINRDKFPLPAGWEMGPIPLTPEILEKAGFIVTSNFHPEGPTFRINANRVGFVSVSPLYQMVDIVRGFSYLRVYDIKFVHQLQNLYFALTWEELEIEL